jgi:hypothetical protein
MNCPKIAGVLCADATDVCCLDGGTTNTADTTHEACPIDGGLTCCQTDDFPCVTDQRVTEHEPLDENVFASTACPMSGLPCVEAAKLSPICCADVPPTAFDGNMHYDGTVEPVDVTESFRCPGYPGDVTSCGCVHEDFAEDELADELADLCSPPPEPHVATNFLVQQEAAGPGGDTAVVLDLTVLSIDDLFTELEARLDGDPLVHVIEGARRCYEGI